MKAAVNRRYGPPDVVSIREVETPVPGPADVLVRVRATTVNRTDSGFRQADPFIVRPFSGVLRPRRTVLGSEFAGDVASVGAGVASFRPGDRVFGLTGNAFGAHAEYLRVPESGAVATMPEGMPYEEAAAVCDGAMLAYTFVRGIGLRPAQRLLVYGASGSIGTSAVQLAKAAGARVTAVCGTRNVDLVRSLGADEVIDFTRDDFTQADGPFDAVLDAVGRTSFGRCKQLLREGGTYVSTDLGYLWQNPLLALASALGGKRKVRFPIPRERKEDILYFKRLLEEGGLRAVIDRRYPLDRIVDAYRFVETGQKVGSVVVTVATRE